MTRPSCGIINAKRLDGLRAIGWPYGGLVELELEVRRAGGVGGGDGILLSMKDGRGSYLSIGRVADC